MTSFWRNNDVIIAQCVCWVLTILNAFSVRIWQSHWRHNDHGVVSNHQPHDCILNRLFRRWSKKTSKLCVPGLCAGNSPGSVNSPHKEPVTREMVPFDDVIMIFVPQNGSFLLGLVILHTGVASVPPTNSITKHSPNIVLAVPIVLVDGSRHSPNNTCGVN